MIKVNELRIGNLFQDKHTKKAIEATELTKEYIVFSGSFKERWQAVPIPLTEEILLKCGFEFEKDCFEEDNKWLNLNHGNHKFNTDTSVNYETVYYQCFKGSVEIKYLHQLQNLYFALTNKELEIKL